MDVVLTAIHCRPTYRKLVFEFKGRLIYSKEEEPEEQRAAAAAEVVTMQRRSVAKNRGQVRGG